MQNSTEANAIAIAIAIEEIVDATVRPITNQPVNSMYRLHHNKDDATNARHCQSQNHPLNSSNHSTPQPPYCDSLSKPDVPLDLTFEDNAPPQVGLVTLQDPYFAPTYQHIPYEIDSWFQVPCIPTSIPTMPPSSSLLHSQNLHSPVSSTSSFTLSMPTSSHSTQGQPQGTHDMFRPTEYQLALDYNRYSPHHEPCKTEAMKQAGASPAHFKNPEFQPILWSPTKDYRRRPT